ncbi:MAG: hypothetical protein KC656_17795, partial [Myxococcales bacterium]|nr:hypothetical protein [Myxococcales bacterium]
MSRVHLSSWATLEALLRSDAVPAEVAGSPAHVGKDIDGVWIQAALDGPTEGRLRAGGARLSPDAGGGREVTCWAEAVPLRRGPPGESPRVLFELPADGLLALAGELVRLGCDRQSWARTGDVAWIEAVDPPWYSVLSALEGQG